MTMTTLSNKHSQVYKSTGCHEQFGSHDFSNHASYGTEVCFKALI